MANSVSLPYIVPTFATTHSSGAAELAMIGHPTAYNQTLNQATDIACSRSFLHGITTPLVWVPNVHLHCYKFIERYHVNLRFAHPFCLDVIKSMLHSGMYIYFHLVDDFYLPGKSWYGTRHMHHDGLIVGYDDNDETISILAHNINFVYDLIRVPQKCFQEAVNSSIEAEQYGNLTAYTITKDTVAEINEQKMLRHLKEYMDSSFEKYPPDVNGEVRGNVVHDYIAMYIGKLKDGSIPFERMDWRALRPIWEHKQCMLRRIRAVEEKNGWDNDLSNRYAPLVEKANCLRIMYGMYHKNHNDKLLDKLQEGILYLGKKDKELVGELIKRLEEMLP